MQEFEFTLEDAQQALGYLDAADRDLWVKMAMALRAEFGDGAFDAWDTWSQSADSYSAASAKATWRSCTKSGISIGTLIKLASDAGWKPEKRELSQEDIKRLKSEQDARRAQRVQQAKDEERRSRLLQQAAAEAARTVWQSLSQVGQSDYLQRKRVKGYGVKYPKQGLLIITRDEADPPTVDVVGGRDEITAFFEIPEAERPSYKYLKPGAAVVPLYDADRNICNLQLLWPTGKKSYLKGAQKQGAYGSIDPSPSDSKPLVICEGYATGAAIAEATGYQVLLAFDAGNLRPVCDLARAWLPQAEIIVAADDDHKTEGNPGLTKAKSAAMAVNARLVVPAFKKRGEGDTDFNDLFIAEGLDVVREQFVAGGEIPQPDVDQPEIYIDWKSDLTKTPTGKVKANPYNLATILENDRQWDGVLGYSEFSYSVLKLKAPPFPQGKPGEWTDTDTTRLRAWCEQKYGFTPNNADASEVVNAVAQNHSFHEVRDYLEGLAWDGKNRIEFWLHAYLGAQLTPYSQLVGRMWLIGAVARVMQYPVKADSVLILEGPQGVGKSTAAAVLGGGWFSDTSFHLGDKDGYQQMRGVWICELAELDSFNKAESTRAKSFFSSVSDRYRPPYGRHVVEYPRQCVFVGTTNQEQYLKDVSGNRRYWPVWVDKVDIAALQADKDQLWAEAVFRYEQGWVWHPAREDLPLFEMEQDYRFDTDVWEELICDYLLGITAKRVLMHEIMAEALKMDPAHMKPPEQKRVGLIMSRLGWRKCRPRAANGDRQTGYEAPVDWRKELKSA